MFKKLIAVVCALSLVASQMVIVSVSAKDKTAPVMKIATPKNNQTGIATNVKISLKFSENIYKSKYFSKIKLTKSKKAVTATASIYKNYLKIAHKYLLTNSAWYVLSVPAYSVKDKSGNILKKAFTIKFRIKAKKVVTPTPTKTPTKTPSPSPTATPTPTPVNTISEAWSVKFATAAPNWQSSARSLGTANTGYELINYDITPKTNNSDALVGYADSSVVFENTDTDFWKLGMAVRLNKEGYIDAMKGGDGDEGGGLPATLAYTKYTAGTKYHIEILANVSDKTYSVWVTPQGGERRQIAFNWGFRLLSNMDDVGKVCFAGYADNDFKIENHTIAHVSAPAATPVPTLAPNPAAGTATVNNDAELTAALANTGIGHITLAAGTYSGFQINKPVEIIGSGATVNTFITINSGNVTIDNVDVVLTATFCHAYNVNAGMENVIIKNGSITGFTYLSNTVSGGSRGIVVAPSSTTELTVDHVNFTKLWNGITANDGYFAGCKLAVTGCTFESTVKYAIGGTENINIVNISGNSFTAGNEGIGLGKGLTISAPGQTIFTVVTYLKAPNNTFTGYAAGKDVRDYRGAL
ncbi:MAG: Ig-like domain-containing protein [Clostridia bacterium]|jgi:methionine-rich copper-binding protein CopC